MEINILLIITLVIALIKAIDGFKKGMVKQIVSLITLIILGAVFALVAYIISSYSTGKVLNIIVAIILLTALAIVHSLLKIIFFSAKVISKLPVVSIANKLLGVVFGLVEVVFILWTLYAIIIYMELGAVEQIIMSYTVDSKILSTIYNYNYFAYWLQLLFDKLSFLPMRDLLEKLKPGK